MPGRKGKPRGAEGGGAAPAGVAGLGVTLSLPLAITGGPTTTIPRCAPLARARCVPGRRTFCFTPPLTCSASPRPPLCEGMLFVSGPGRQRVACVVRGHVALRQPPLSPLSLSLSLSSPLSCSLSLSLACFLSLPLFLSLPPLLPSVDLNRRSPACRFPIISRFTSLTSPTGWLRSIEPNVQLTRAARGSRRHAGAAD